MADVQIRVSQWAAHGDLDPLVRRPEWPLAFLVHQLREHDDGAAWSPGRLGDGGAVAEVDALALRVDGGATVSEVVGRLRAARVESVVVSSWGHDADRPAFVVVAPFAEPLPAEMYRPVWTSWAAEWPGGLDPAGADPMERIPWPARPAHGPEPVAMHLEGERLDGLAVAAHAEAHPSRAIAARPAVRLGPDVDAHYLGEIVGLLAGAAPPGGRAAFFAAVAGALVDGGVPRGWALRVVERACSPAGTEAPDAGDCFRAAAERLRSLDGPGLKALPPQTGALLEAMLRWRALFGPYVPVGCTGGDLLFHNGRLARLPIQQSTHETRLGVTFGGLWSAAKRTLGLSWTTARDGEGNEVPVSRVDDQKAHREMAGLLGLVCHRDVPDERLADGVHVVGGQTYAVSSAGTYRLAESRWSRLPIPVIDRVVCQPTGKVQGAPAWWPLDDLADAYRRLWAAFDGWKFEAQANTVQLLSALALSIPVLGCSSSSAAPWYWIQGRTNSGKSQLCRALAAVSAHVEEVGNASPYAIMAMLGNRNVAAIVDDVEGNRRSTAQRDSLLDQYRAGLMVRGNGGRTVSGLDRAKLIGPLIYSGISGPDQDQDLNRFFQVRLEHRADWPDPLRAAEREFSALRAVCSWGLAGHLPAWLVAREQAQAAADDIGIPARPARNLVPLAATLLLLGEDPTYLLLGWEAGTALDLTDHGTQEQRLFDYVLDLPLPDGTGGLVSLRDRMVSGSDRLPCNVGHWQPATRSLALNSTALKTALPARSEYADWSVKRLSEVLRQHPAFERLDVHPLSHRRCLFFRLTPDQVEPRDAEAAPGVANSGAESSAAVPF